MNKRDSWSSYKQSSRTLESGYTWCIDTIEAIFLPVLASNPAPFPLQCPNHVSLLPQAHVCPSITPEQRYEEAHGFNQSRLHHGDVRYQPSGAAGLADTCQATPWWIAHKHAITHSWAWAHSDQRRWTGRKREQERDRRGRDVGEHKSGGRMGRRLSSVMSLIFRKSAENPKAGKPLQVL